MIKVTDDSADVKITYEYDVLGEITSESNPDGITNPFKYRGASQTVYDDSTDLYEAGLAI